MKKEASTGEKCPQGGIWACSKDGKEHSVGIGNIMPPCSQCNKAVTFNLVRASN